MVKKDKVFYFVCLQCGKKIGIVKSDKTIRVVNESSPLCTVCDSSKYVVSEDHPFGQMLIGEEIDK